MLDDGLNIVESEMILPQCFILTLVQWGSREDRGLVIVQDQVPKVKDFLAKDCWKVRGKPPRYMSYV